MSTKQGETLARAKRVARGISHLVLSTALAVEKHNNPLAKGSRGAYGVATFDKATRSAIRGESTANRRNKPNGRGGRKPSLPWEE